MSFSIMHRISILFACLALFALSSQASSPQELFADFQTKYNVQYNDQNEFVERFRVFTQNLEIIELLNQRERELNGKVVFGITKFADWTPKEFHEKLLIKSQPTKDLFRYRRKIWELTSVESICLSKL